VKKSQGFATVPFDDEEFPPECREANYEARLVILATATPHMRKASAGEPDRQDVAVLDAVLLPLQSEQTVSPGLGHRP